MKGEVSAFGRSNGDGTRASTGTEQDVVGASITPVPVDRNVFRLHLTALLRPRGRPGRTGTPPWKRHRSWAAGVGPFEELEREVSRSRRFGHSFLLARIPCRRPGAEADGWHERTLALLSSLIRSVDGAWFDGRDIYVLFPESDRVTGTAALARIREPLAQVLSEEELDGIAFAVFAPDECPTSGALLAALHGRVNGAKARPPGPPRKVRTAVADRGGGG